MRRVPLALGLALVACSSLEVHGGRTVRAGDEPAGTVIGAWVTADCRDAHGGAVEQSSRVFLVRRPNRRAIAIETRPAYDSIVVTNAFVAGRELVFQVAFHESDPLVLRELRLPADAKGPGRLVVASSFTEPEAEGGRFRATIRTPAFSCRLEPVASAAPPPPPSPDDAGAPIEAGD